MGIKATFAFMITWELLLLLASLTIMGVWADAPRPSMVAMSDSLGITVYDLAVDIFILGTIFGIIIACLIAVWRGKPWG